MDMTRGKEHEISWARALKGVAAEKGNLSTVSQIY